MEVSLNSVQQYQKEFEKVKQYKVLQGVLRKSNLQNVSANENSLNKLPFKFNYALEEEVKITDQHHSGRCWIFAGLNVMRHAMIKQYKLDPSFELSQSWIYRWDKFEKCNTTLEYIYDLAKQNLNNTSLEYAALIPESMTDGGTWSMFTNIVNKYGVVPKDMYPDNKQAKHTSKMNGLLTTLVMQASNNIKSDMTRQEFEELKKPILDKCYRIITLFLGNPLDTFVWAFKDKMLEKSYTPLSFYQTIIKPLVNVDKYVNVCHFPVEELNSVLGVEYTHNVLYEGEDVKLNKHFYVNLDIEEIKSAVWKSIAKQRGVWFACDIGKYWLNKGTILDKNSSNIEDMFDIDFNASKRQGLMARTNIPNHAMMFSGVHKNEKGFERWKVENSHGDDVGTKGFITMSDKWFSEYVICAAVPIDCLSLKARKLLKQKPKWLPFWSPLGTFAYKEK